jgi:hypothetical protein
MPHPLFTAWSQVPPTFCLLFTEYAYICENKWVDMYRTYLTDKTHEEFQVEPTRTYICYAIFRIVKVLNLWACRKMVGFCCDHWYINQHASHSFLEKPLKTIDSKSSHSAFHIHFHVTGLPSHTAADCILSLFFKMVNNIKEQNPYHLPISLSD